MISEVIVDVKPKEVSIALLEDKRLMEFQQENRADNYSVGTVYVAKVKKIMPGLNACFVDLGYEKDAFLHFWDLGLQFYSYERFLKKVGKNPKANYTLAQETLQKDLPKEENIQNVLKVGQPLLVQVMKEPISTKGPRLSCDLSFAGRFLILVPFKDSVNISSKIKNSSERTRLKQLIQTLKPKNFGVVIRTAAEGKRAADLDKELRSLQKKWDEALKVYKRATKYPTLAVQETNRIVALLRDLFNPSFQAIHVNDEDVFNELTDYISSIAPNAKDVVKYYKGETPIFDYFSVTKQLRTSFGKNVTYNKGAYLVIEQTEAFHVIDVNSGNKASQTEGTEETALSVNLGAADEIARQLRLRDMGGIIVIDFIDLHNSEHKQQLYERMCQNMEQDRAKHNILPLSKFGLMQITRQRVRPAMELNVEESCPTCHGTGKATASFLFTETLEKYIRLLVQQLGIKKIRLHVHPYVAAYINQGIFSLNLKWKFKYSQQLSIISDQSLGFLQFQFYDSEGTIIELEQ